MKSLRVLALCHPAFLLDDATVKTMTEAELYAYKTERDVEKTLTENGHVVRMLGVQTELTPIRDAIEEWKPDIVFNLLEEFHGETLYAQNVVALLELLQVPYTGCNPRGLMLARGKDLSKKLLKYHRVPAPAFAVFPKGKKGKRPAGLTFPLIVKSLSEDSSRGISQASVVETDDKLAERVTFIHERIGTAAIVEEYIEGREIYVGVIGNEKQQALPVWELEFQNLADGARPIATERVKHDFDYQERRGVVHGKAENLAPALQTRIQNLAKRIYQTLEIDGYARIDFRLTPEDVPYFLEANPNPEIASSDEFANAAGHAGINYHELLDRILVLGLRRAGSTADQD